MVSKGRRESQQDDGHRLRANVLARSRNSRSKREGDIVAFMGNIQQSQCFMKPGRHTKDGSAAGLIDAHNASHAIEACGHAVQLRVHCRNRKMSKGHTELWWWW